MATTSLSRHPLRQRSLLRRHPLLQETSALTRRLLLQLKRRPSSLIVGLLQPLIWLVLFGSLFTNSRVSDLPVGMSYGQFLSAGLIVFTSFNGALNAGLPVMFDREFGFLNRMLVAPLKTRHSIVAASIIEITAVSMLQSLTILLCSAFMGYGFPSSAGMPVLAITLLLISTAVTALSLGLAFTLPGHVELLAVTLLINLPLLFTSTALAPLGSMPTWLRWVASLNPLSWAIEPIRSSYSEHFSWHTQVLITPFGNISNSGCLLLLTLFSTACLMAIRPLVNRKLS